MSWNLHCYCLLAFCLALTAVIELGLSAVSVGEPSASRQTAVVAVGSHAPLIPSEWPR